MSKSEKRACQYTGYCRNQSYSDFLNGYHQAEKDNELTPEDISTIYSLMINAVFELRSENPSFKGADIYQEVLKRFKAKKNDTTSK